MKFSAVLHTQPSQYSYFKQRYKMKFKFSIFIALLFSEVAFASQLPLAQIMDICAPEEREMLPLIFPESNQIRSASIVTRKIRNQMIAEPDATVLVKFRDIDHLMEISKEYPEIISENIVLFFDPTASSDLSESIVQSDGKALEKGRFFHIASETNMISSGRIHGKGWKFIWSTPSEFQDLGVSKDHSQTKPNLEEIVQTFSCLHPSRMPSEILGLTHTLQADLAARKEDREKNPDRYKIFKDIMNPQGTFISQLSKITEPFDSLRVQGHHILYGETLDALLVVKNQFPHIYSRGEMNVVGFDGFNGIYCANYEIGKRFLIQSAGSMMLYNIGTEKAKEYDLEIKSEKELWIVNSLHANCLRIYTKNPYIRTSLKEMVGSVPLTV